MEEGMTRKGFIAAAAAAGMAAMVPSLAIADELEAAGDIAEMVGTESAAGVDAMPISASSPLSALDVQTVEGSEALAGSEWASVLDAGYPIDVVKSHSGLHSMNAPGYFVFTGWDSATDWVSDMGFGFFNNTFFVRSRQVDVWSSDIRVNGEPVADWVVEAGRSGLWSYEKWASGKAECWARRSYDVDPGRWAPSAMFPGAYAVDAVSTPGGIEYPFRFVEPPYETFSVAGVAEGECELFTTGKSPNTETNMGVYQLYRSPMATAKAVTVVYDVKIRGVLA